MRRRLLKALVVVGAVALLAGAGTVRCDHASASHASASGYNVGIVYSRTGLLSAYGAEYVEGLQVRHPVRDQRHRQGQRQDDQPLLRRRRDRSGHRRLADEELHRPGLHDHRRRGLLGRRAAGGADRRPEPRALHLRPRGLGRGHGAQQVHVPLGPPDLPGRRRRRRPTCSGSGKNVVVFAQDSAFGQGNYAAVKAIIGGKGHTVTPIYVPLIGDRLDAVRPAGEAGEPGPALRRVGRLDRHVDVVGARPAERLLERQVDRHRPRRAGDLPELRPGGREDPVHLALRLPGADEQGERLARSSRCARRASSPTCSRRTASSPAR